MAINFAGGTDRVSFGDGFNAGQGCAAGWFKTTQVTTNAGMLTLWNTSSRFGFGVLLNNVANKLTIAAYPGNTPEAVLMASSASINDGSWHHFAYNWDTGLTNPNYLYIAGVLDITQNAARAWSIDNASPLYLGDSNATFWASYVGDMGEPAIWLGRHLTANEIAALGKGFSPRNIAPSLDRFYAPLLRNPHNRVDPFFGSQVGTTVSPHPRVFGGMA